MLKQKTSRAHGALAGSITRDAFNEGTKAHYGYFTTVVTLAARPHRDVIVM